VIHVITFGPDTVVMLDPVLLSLPQFFLVTLFYYFERERIDTKLIKGVMKFVFLSSAYVTVPPLEDMN